MMNLSFFENKNYWIKELAKINDNIPKKRIRLNDVLLIEDPHFITSGGKIFINKNELTKFASRFSSEMFNLILLPLILLQKQDHFVTSGNKYDIWVIERLMDHEESNILISIQNYHPKHSYYYSYQVNRIRKEFPTLIQVIYSM